MTNKGKNLLLVNIAATIINIMLLFAVTYSLNINGFFNGETERESKGEIVKVDTLTNLVDSSRNKLDIIGKDVFQYFKPDDVTFVTGKYLLTGDGKKALTILAELLKREKYQKFGIKVDGHTDNVGSDEINLILSEKRAKEIYNFLTKEAMIASHRVKYEGFGESQPKFNNNTPEGKKGNRRVEFSLFEIK